MTTIAYPSPRPRATRARRAQRGLSLVELMIALVLGLVISMAAGQIYLSSRQSFSTHEELARLNEDTRVAIEILSRAIRNAGFDPNNSEKAFPGETGTCAGAVGSELFALCGANDDATAVNSSDELLVRFHGFDFPAGTADGSILDCQGNAVGASQLAVERYRVENEGGQPALVCRSSVGGAAEQRVVLVPGVESLQVLFGADTDNNQQVDRWVPPFNGITGGVRAVRVSVVARDTAATANSRASADTRVYNHFGSGYAPGNAAPGGDAGSVFDPADDRRLRHMADATVALRNFLD